MPVQVHSCLIQGISGKLVEIEADILSGLSAFTIVGLGDQSVQESKERIRSAIRSTSANYPSQKKIINLAPASLKKNGPSFDLPIAVSLLVASKQIPQEKLQKVLLIGELALNGHLRPVKNALSIAIFARENGWRKLILPTENFHEASLVENLELLPFQSLQQVLEYLTGKSPAPELPELRADPQPSLAISTFLAIHGQQEAKRALMISAAGGHHLLMYGPPGVGKTMLAKALPELLPKLSREELFETIRIHSAADQPTTSLLAGHRPFRHLHQSSTLNSLIGGGNPLKPGEISLAHRGILFMDEFPEFPRSVIESLRQPLEDKQIHLSRTGQQVTYPANFTLVAAMNPCPCGNFGNSEKNCLCSLTQINHYRQKLSGPILDRIDLTVSLPKTNFNLFAPTAPARPPELSPSVAPVAKDGHAKDGSAPAPSAPTTPGCPQRDTSPAKRPSTAPSTPANRHSPASRPQTATFPAPSAPDNLQTLLATIATAHSRQKTRFAGTSIRQNSDLNSVQLRQYLKLTDKAQEYLKIITDRTLLSARNQTQLLRTALTIADLKNQDEITNLELAEAFQYKNSFDI